MSRYLPGLLLAAAFGLLCWQNIDQPDVAYFDETHYIPAAKSYLESGPQLRLEHPPLGKIIVAQGLKYFGDNPRGWRVMGTIFGMLTLFGIYVWALVIFESTASAVFAALIAAFNQMLFVQARIAMLDTFMATFLIFGGVFFSLWWRRLSNGLYLSASAFFLGLAVAVKWFGLIPLGILGLVAFVLQRKNGEVGWKSIFLAGLAGFVAYAMWFSPSEFLSAQMEIWSLQQRVPPTHGYSSAWWSWPLQIRPIWYHFLATEDPSLVRGVALIGNPLVLWGGIIALVICLWQSIVGRHRVAGEVSLVFLLLWLGWALVPRELAFFYYYYPAVLSLSLVWTQATLGMRRGRWALVVAAAVMFVFFYPILSASVIPIQDLGRWMWFERWI